MKKIFGSLILLFSMGNAFALYQTNITPTIVGVDAYGGFFVGIDINTNNCAYSGVSFASTDAGAKAMLATVYLAKATNKVIRIDFNRNATNGSCTGYAVYVQ
jgi:hypothetical protein